MLEVYYINSSLKSTKIFINMISNSLIFIAILCL